MPDPALSAESEISYSNLVEYLALAGATLQAYDFLLTLPSEIEHMWKRPKNATFLMFVGLRYANLSYQPLQLVFSNTSTGLAPVCQVVFYTSHVLELIATACLYGTFVLRTWAIWDRSAILLAILAFPGVVIVGMASIPFLVVERLSFGHEAGMHGCTATFPAYTSSWLPTVQSAIIVSLDTAVLCLTLARTMRLAWDMRKLKLQWGFGPLLLRDGILYYLIIDAMVITTIILNQLKTWTPSAALDGLGLPVAAVLVQRLILNPRSTAEICQHTYEGLGYVEAWSMLAK